MLFIVRYKLLIVFFFIYYHGNSQSFSLESLQTNKQIEVALDSAYQWTEQANIKSFTANYFIVEEAVELSENEEYKARFNAYRAIFFCYLYDNDQFKDYLDASLAFYEAHEDRVMLTYIYNIKGIYESYVNEDYHESATWHKKAVSLIHPINKKLEKIAVDAYFNLAISSSRVEDWDAVVEASSKSIELALKYNKSRLPRMYYHRGFALFNKQDIHGAIENFKLSEELITEIEKNTGEKVHYKDAAYLFGFSEVYKVLGDDKKSADYVREYNYRMKEGVYRFSKYTGLRIQKHSGILVDFAKKKEEKRNMS